MMSAIDWPVLIVLVLGIWHGINPGMGWLFAVALGLQERDRRAVWRALLPLAAGHGLAIAVTLAGAALLGMVLPAAAMKWSVAIVLTGYGVLRLVRTRHPRYGAMRMSMRKLTVWSFLMASAHGAGLMVLPFVLPTGVTSSVEDGSGDHVPMSAGAQQVRSTPVRGTASESGHMAHATKLAGAAEANPPGGWIVLLVHTMGYLLATSALAVVVYERLGLRLLRRMWFNLDLIWGVALVATGVLAPFV